MRRALRWLSEAWGFGPVFAVQALLLAYSALHEMDAASERQAAEMSTEGTRQCVNCGDHLSDVGWIFDPCPASEDGDHSEASERQRNAAYSLGCQHGRLVPLAAPYGDLNDAGSADLMTELGETEATTEANYDERVSLLAAYVRGWEKTSGRNYERQVAR